MLNKDQLLGIKHGIEKGFENQGYNLTPRERFIIELSVQTTSDTLKTIIGGQRDE